jgi:hypothetical protein
MLYDKEFRDLYRTPGAVGIMKSRRLGWAEHVARMEKRGWITSWKRSLDSSLNIALGCELDDRGFESRHGLGIYLFTTAYRPAWSTHSLLSNG